MYDNADAAQTGRTVANAVGQVTTATSYAGGAAYVSQARGFTAFGSSVGTVITVPDVEGDLAGTYTYTHSYDADTDLPFRDVISSVSGAGLPTETLTHGYQGLLDLPVTLSGAVGTSSYSYTGDIEYDAYGRMLQATLGTGTTGTITLTNTWDAHTGRQTGQNVTTSTSATGACQASLRKPTKEGFPSLNMPTDGPFIGTVTMPTGPTQPDAHTIHRFGRRRSAGPGPTARNDLEPSATNTR